MTRVLTEEQRKRKTERQRERRQQKRERGECRDCKQPIYKGGYCEKHYAKHLASVNDVHDKRRESGICVRCDKPTYKGGYCEEHYIEQLERVNSYAATIRDVLGNVCNRCGDNANLHIHHINFDGQEHRKQFSGSQGAYRDLIQRGIPEDEVELLCNCCHREVHREHRAKQLPLTAIAAD